MLPQGFLLKKDEVVYGFYNKCRTILENVPQSAIFAGVSKLNPLESRFINEAQYTSKKVIFHLVSFVVVIYL